MHYAPISRHQVTEYLHQITDYFQSKEYDTTAEVKMLIDLGSQYSTIKTVEDQQLL